MICTDSTTETYAALRLQLDNWRWSGVPFYIRTGKRLAATQTEVRVVFKQPPNLGFISFERTPEPDQFVIKLDPTTGAQLTMEARRGDNKKAQAVTLDLEFAQQGGEGATRKKPASRSSSLPNTLGESKLGTHNQSIAPSAATSAPV